MEKPVQGESGLQLPAQPLFSGSQLRRLIIPLIIEQFLLITVGMADTVMVTTAGEAAVSGVSLVDNINNLLLQIFAALCTGGTVVVSQYLGHREEENAQKAAKQLLGTVGAISLVLMTLALVFRARLLNLVFGTVNDDVMQSAVEYFLATALAYPFIAVYNAGAALFRAVGNSRVSMFNSAVVNVVNIGVNALLIYGFGLGALGAGIGTLVSRIVGASVILYLLWREGSPLPIRGMLRFRFDWGIVKRILYIGVPNGIEGGLFHMGRLLVLRLVTSFDVGVDLAVMGSAVAAYGITGSIIGFSAVPGQAMGLALVTVASRCMGAGDPGEATRYTWKFVRLCYLAVGAASLILLVLSGPITACFHMSEATSVMVTTAVRWSAVCTMAIWPLSFMLPNTLRAAGDTKYTMAVAILSMFAARVGLSYLLGPSELFGIALPGVGYYSVWIGMFSDWGLRAVIFTIHFLRGKWKKFKVI